MIRNLFFSVHATSIRPDLSAQPEDSGAARGENNKEDGLTDILCSKYNIKIWFRFGKDQLHLDQPQLGQLLQPPL